MSKNKTVYKDTEEKQRAVKNIRFKDFKLISLLYQDYNFINKKINWIQEKFAFSRSVTVYYYNTIEEMQREIPVKLPEWIKGLSSPNGIYILNPMVWKEASEDDSLAKIFIHEYMHVAIFNSFFVQCPSWLNEGLAQVISEQFIEQKNRNMILPYDYYKKNYQDEDFYYQSALIVSVLIKKTGIYKLLDHCKKCYDFENDEMIGVKALQKMQYIYLGKLK